jgi:hypothetical protein
LNDEIRRLYDCIGSTEAGQLRRELVEFGVRHAEAMRSLPEAATTETPIASIDAEYGDGLKDIVCDA